MSQKHSCIPHDALSAPPPQPPAYSRQRSGSRGGLSRARSKFTGSLFIPVGKLVLIIWPILTITVEWTASLPCLGTDCSSGATPLVKGKGSTFEQVMKNVPRHRNWVIKAQGRTWGRLGTSSKSFTSVFCLVVLVQNGIREGIPPSVRW